MLKAGILGLLVVAACGVIVVAAIGARARGKLAYCRNNLRALGELGSQKLLQGEVTKPGRGFWQEIRLETCSVHRNDRDEWLVRFGGLNPFGCPVLGVQPLDLAALARDNKAQFEKVMSDPATIDYFGPKQSIDPQAPATWIIAGDRPGNHPHGGHVLTANLTVREMNDQIIITEWRSVDDISGKLSD